MPSFMFLDSVRIFGSNVYVEPGPLGDERGGNAEEPIQ